MSRHLVRLADLPDTALCEKTLSLSLAAALQELQRWTAFLSLSISQVGEIAVGDSYLPILWAKDRIGHLTDVKAAHWPSSSPPHGSPQVSGLGPFPHASVTTPPYFRGGP